MFHRASIGDEDHGLAWRKACWTAGLLLALAVGCSSKQPAEPSKDMVLAPGDPAIVAQGPPSAEIRPLDDAGAALEFDPNSYVNGQPTRYADGSPIYFGNGQPIDYRPRNLQRKIDRVPRLYLRDIGLPPLKVQPRRGLPQIVYLNDLPQARVFLPGQLDVIRVDPQSGAVCWRAMMCRNPACSAATSSQPLVFAASIAGYQPGAVLAASAPALPTPTRGYQDPPTMFDGLVCPYCDRADRLEPYDPPETEAVTVQLRDELARVRAARVPRP